MTIQKNQIIRFSFITVSCILGMMMLIHAKSPEIQKNMDSAMQQSTKKVEGFHKDSVSMEGMWLPVVEVQSETTKQSLNFLFDGLVNYLSDLYPDAL